MRAHNVAVGLRAFQPRGSRRVREQFLPSELPKTQTASPQTALFRHFLPRWSVFWAPRPSDSLRGGGNCAMQGCDTPATRRHSTSHGAKPPHHPQRRAPRHPTGRLGHPGTAAECDTNSQWSGPTVSLRRLGATAGPEATSRTQYGRQTDQQEAPRSDVQLGSAATRIIPSPEICILCPPPLKSLC